MNILGLSTRLQNVAFPCRVWRAVGFIGQLLPSGKIGLMGYLYRGRAPSGVSHLHVGAFALKRYSAGARHALFSEQPNHFLSV